MPSARTRTMPAGPAELAGLHALAFLVIGNAVGLLMALLLLAPRAGATLGSLTYGRWAPVHLGVHLYGWAALPLVALLLASFSSGEHAPRLGRLAVHAWSAMVVVGGASWLMGGSSGKAFLDWTGGARDVMVAAMALLSLALLASLARGFRGWTPAGRAGRAALIAVLVPVPLVLAWAVRPDVSPSINPDSGGPTGVSLMGSVLGLVALLALTPPLLGLRSRSRVTAQMIAAGLAIHGIAFLLLDHGDASHRDPVQAIALASVIPWLPLLALHLRAVDWPAGRSWLRASLGWGVVLLLSGLLAFLPGVLERLKFGHALVAHAHVALAGLLTSWNMLVLSSLPGAGSVGAAVAGTRACLAWNAALAVHVVALSLLALLEARSPGGLLPEGLVTDALLALRAASGAAQLAISGWWLFRAAREAA